MIKILNVLIWLARWTSDKLQNLKIKLEDMPMLSKRSDFDKMGEEFRDSNGKRYYKYLNDFNIPITRFNKLQSFIIELGNCISRNELDEFITAFERALAGDKTGGKPDMAMMGFLIQEIKDRKRYLVYEDILFKMVSCLYIHEDQEPSVWDEEFEMRKAEQFKKDSKNNYDFFLKAGLSKYINYLKSLKGNYRELSELTKKRVEAMSMMLKKYNETSGSDQKLSTSIETETMS